jgi:Zn-dependent peptidase ImmA (M78 family)/transcriptional regulator with XRE-family HTH domain
MMIGERMRQARLLAGLTQEQAVGRLSEYGIGLTKAGLSKYERGGSNPSASLLLKLAKVLDVPSSYFLREPEVRVRWLAFRKLSGLSRREQERIEAKAQEYVERQVWLHEKLFPEAAVRFPKAAPACTQEDAENAAAKLRKTWGLGTLPVESVAETIEERGGIVVEYSEHKGEFHGLAGWANGRYPVIVTTGTALDDRRRFNLAHELGHLFMNCNGLDEKKQENLAQRFAAAFIVPPALARRELGSRRRNLTLFELGFLKQKHGLSLQAWIRRAFDLGIIDRQHYNGWCRRVSAQGWRKNEPVPFHGREKPSRLRQMTLRALAEGLITPDRAKQIFPECAKVIGEEPSERPPGYLSALDVIKLPKSERERILAEAAVAMAKEYESNRELAGFDAFGEKDLYDGSL